MSRLYPGLWRLLFVYPVYDETGKEVREEFDMTDPDVYEQAEKDHVLLGAGATVEFVMGRQTDAGHRHFARRSLIVPVTEKDQ